MKMISLATLICLVLLGCGMAVGKTNKKPYQGELKSYEYSRWGTMAYPDFYVHLRGEEGIRLLSYADHNHIDTITVEVGQEVFDRVSEMVISNKLHQLKEQYKPPFRVLDGYSWHVYVKFTDGSISSRGNNAMPKNISLQEINEYLRDLVLRDVRQDE